MRIRSNTGTVERLSQNIRTPGRRISSPLRLALQGNTNGIAEANRARQRINDILVRYRAIVERDCGNVEVLGEQFREMDQAVQAEINSGN